MVRDAHYTMGSCAAAILGSVRIALLRADPGLPIVFKGGIHVPTWSEVSPIFRLEIPQKPGVIGAEKPKMGLKYHLKWCRISSISMRILAILWQSQMVKSETYHPQIYQKLVVPKPRKWNWTAHNGDFIWDITDKTDVTKLSDMQAKGDGPLWPREWWQTNWMEWGSEFWDKRKSHSLTVTLFLHIWRGLSFSRKVRPSSSNDRARHFIQNRVALAPHFYHFIPIENAILRATPATPHIRCSLFQSL